MKTQSMLIAWIVLMTRLASGGVPALLTYQGRLLDGQGEPVNGQVAVAVGIYTNETGGAAAYSESVGSVPVLNGIYSFQFGTNAAAVRSALENPECWLEVVVEGDAFAPRHRLAAVPYAIRSGDVDAVGANTAFAAGVVAGAAIADGAVSSGKLAPASVGLLQLDPDLDGRYVKTAGDRMTGDLDLGGHSASNGVFAGDGAELTNLAWGSLIGLPENLDTDGFDDLVTNDIGVKVQSHSTNLDDLADGTLSKSRVEDSANWDSAYGWGNHATGGYLTAYTETDPQWAAASNQYYTRPQADALFATGTPLYVEGDPLWSAVSNAALTEAAHGETAYGWGNHATGGYLTAYTETDPQWAAASNQYYTRPQADALFATGTPLYVEGDPLWSAVSNNFVRKSGDTMSGALIITSGGFTVGTTQLVVLAGGNVGIGTANPTNRLAVNGTIKAREVVVSPDGWADFVLTSDYPLMPLEETERYIRANGHLPGVPSAREVGQAGVELGGMQATLLRKIEELTLHVIELKKENHRLQRRLDVSGVE